jgi:hypothetical protein
LLLVVVPVNRWVVSMEVWLEVGEVAVSCLTSLRLEQLWGHTHPVNSARVEEGTTATGGHQVELALSISAASIAQVTAYHSLQPL